MPQTSRNTNLSLPQAYNMLGVLHQGSQPLHGPIQFQAPRRDSSHITLSLFECPRRSSTKSCGRAEGICMFPASPQARPAGKQRSELHSDPRQRGHYHCDVVLAQFSAQLQPESQVSQCALWSWCTNPDLILPHSSQHQTQPSYAYTHLPC